MSQKGLSSIILVIGAALLVVLGGGYYIYSQKPSTPPTLIFPAPLTPIPTTDSTADWKTYTSNKYSFSFQYPEDFSNYLEEPDWGVRMGCACESFNWFDIEVIKSTMSPTDWWKNNGKKVFNGKDRLEAFQATASATTIGNLPVVKVDATTSVPTFKVSPHPAVRIGATPFTVYIFQHNNSLIVITDYQSGDKKTFDQILSTFKFTNQATVSPIQILSPTQSPRPTAVKSPMPCEAREGIPCY